MTRSEKLVPGSFIRIPLEDGSFGYGRALGPPYTAFYNYRTTEPSSDLDEIASQPVLFRQSVRLPTDKRWVNIGYRELDGEVARPSLFFMQSVGNFTDCTIFDSAGMRRTATPAECVGLERASVWDAHHIEKRLLDTFMGRPNEYEIHDRVQLSDTI